MPAPIPTATETHDDYVVRCHDALRGEIPETDRRNAVCFATWREHRGDDALEQKAAAQFGREGFELHRDRPVFAEHTTKDSKGNVIVYDFAALKAIKDRCNKRIADTGDFAALTEGHTPESEGIPMPEVLGYDGPFRMGMVGNENPRWAIFADEWHDPTEKAKLRKLRRRSPEVWLNERMQDRFMDPIAALGAETPRLDMGIHYCRTADGKTVEKYTAVAPSSTSVFVPGDGDDDQPEKYEAEGNPVLTPEDVQKVVEAIMQTKPMQYVMGLMEAEEAAATDDTGAPPAGDTPPADTAPPPTADAPPPAPVADDNPPPALPEGDEADENARGHRGFDSRKRYEADDEDREKIAQYMAGGCSEEELQSYMAGKRSKYQADSSAADDPDEDKPMVDTYARTGERERYAKIERENREMKEKLEKTEQRLAKIEADKVYAERYSKLSELSREFALDPEEEANSCRDMTAEQFEKHTERIVARYSRIPAGVSVYTGADEHDPVARDRAARRAEVAEEARKYCLSERKAGREVSYEDALAHVEKSRGTKTA